MVGNRYDNFYGYTGLFPIRDNTGDGSSPIRDLRRVLSTLPFGAGSLFARTGLVHGARMFVIEDVVFNGYPSREEHLKHAYMVLTITFDGELEPLLEKVFETGKAEWARVFEHIYGYPEELTAASLMEHVKACQVTTTFLYVDAEADLERTLLALHAQKVVFDMIAEGQGMDREGRRKLINRTLEKIKTATPTEPGSFTEVGYVDGGVA